MLTDIMRDGELKRETSETKREILEKRDSGGQANKHSKHDLRNATFFEVGMSM